VLIGDRLAARLDGGGARGGGGLEPARLQGVSRQHLLAGHAPARSAVSARGWDRVYKIAIQWLVAWAGIGVPVGRQPDLFEHFKVNLRQDSSLSSESQSKR
jgi:hypothetical protein